MRRYILHWYNCNIARKSEKKNTLGNGEELSILIEVGKLRYRLYAIQMERNLLNFAK
jgi:hypothetical protein